MLSSPSSKGLTSLLLILIIEIKKSMCSVLVHFSGLDERIVEYVLPSHDMQIRPIRLIAGFH